MESSNSNLRVIDADEVLMVVDVLVDVVGTDVVDDVDVSEVGVGVGVLDPATINKANHNSLLIN